MKKLTTEQNRIAQAKYKAKKLAEKQCWQCRKALDNATRLCSECKLAQKERVEARRQRLRQQGLCTHCGQFAAASDLQLCLRCTSVGRIHVARRVRVLTVTGICIRCRKRQAEAGYQSCEHCRMLAMEDNRKVKEELITGYGGRCSCCHESRFEFLTLDHVNNDGKAERSLRGRQIYQRLIRENFPDGYQILCYNCNCAKGIYGICPHSWAETEIIAPREKPSVNYDKRNNSGSRDPVGFHVNADT